ncbi:hypothetical protein ABIE26_004258 [Pedobacter africanus]|uniref:Uncharacterized protein n=1 Tax=Pedobacter africanus TaxID=151894 RepID=A0ACC6L1N2_9SPHI|nr:FAD-dependent oxidoreductase [Pedobacter africanus]MDR6785548.1 hypothetical protein [Pedobacter africanus]
MFKYYILMVVCVITATHTYAQYDLVIVGGNPGGIMAAIAAARSGKTAVILERTAHIGGLPANGLGATDIATRGATTGLFMEFLTRVKSHYVKKFGKASMQVKMCSDGYHFEPAVAELVFEQMLQEHGDRIKVLKMRQFDAEPQHVSITDGLIKRIQVTNRQTGALETYAGAVFIDATYEGDLGAAAGVPFRVGREAKKEFNEPGAGRIYKYWGGPEEAGSTGQGDNAVQAYNYRVCLTSEPGKQVAIEKPERYNRNEYLSLIGDVLTGRNTGVEMEKVTGQMLEDNRNIILKGGRSDIPGDKWGLAKLVNTVMLPNNKTDANNQHQAFISTDLPEENWPWPTSGWDWRDAFAQRLKNYTLGLFYFAQHDAELPESFRKEVLKWGLAKDEYTDNRNFPRQVYVREGRRFEGLYFFTAKDALPVAPGKRPPLHTGSITSSHYALDSHGVRKREPGKVHLDGFLSYDTEVYTVPYGVIVPKVIRNLLLPVPVSGSHIGFSTLRMEPCWMAMGQASGVAAALAIEQKIAVQDVPLGALQDRLLEQGQTLIYYQDVPVSSPDFKMVQSMGLKGFLPGWKADLSLALDQQTASSWAQLSGLKLETIQGKSRGDMLRFLYHGMKKGNQ